MAGVWGKLRLHGDFLALGLDEAARACVVPWLDATLSALREEWGEAWGPRFDGMGMLGFWIGPALAGGAPVAGVMAPSRDKVGRRYPLLILGRGEAVPPMLAPGDFHARAGAALAALLAAGQAEAGAWPQDLGEAVPAPLPDDPSLVWAHNAGCAGGDLLAEILRYDHAAACAGRVQVWTLGAPGAVLTCGGMPSARALGWLIETSQTGDRPADAPVAEGQGEMAAGATVLAALPAAVLPEAVSMAAVLPATAPPSPPGAAVVAGIGAGEAPPSPAAPAEADRPESGPGAEDAPAVAAPPSDALRLEPRFRLGAEEQAESRLVLRAEWALPEGADQPREPVDAAIWHLPDPPAEPAATGPAPDRAREGE